MRSLSQNDLRWFAARLSIAVEETRKSGMSVAFLKAALRHLPGVESMTVAYAANGNELVTIAGRTVEVSPTASNAEISAAFAAPEAVLVSVAADDPVSSEPQSVNSNVSTPLPPAPSPIAPAAAPVTSTPTMSVTGAAPAALSVKDLIASSRSKIQAAHDKLATNAAKVDAAGDALSSLGDNLGKEADDLMAMIGQFTNGTP